MNRKVIGAALLGISLLAGALGVRGYVKEETAGNTYEGLQEAVREEAPAEEVPVSTESLSSEKLPDIPIDFTKLQEECPDAYAWIRIPGTNIDYPIVQSAKDDSFYLSHNVYGAEEYAGSIYTEHYNAKDFSDPNTVIYGHNMANGSMFQNLHYYEDKAFMKEHPTIIIYMPGRILTYRIFAAYNFDDRHLLKSYGFFENSDAFRLYLRKILSIRAMDANIDKDVQVTANDRIVTLSTCNNFDDQRYLVQGVLLSE